MPRKKKAQEPEQPRVFRRSLPGCQQMTNNTVCNKPAVMKWTWAYAYNYREMYVCEEHDKELQENVKGYTEKPDKIAAREIKR